MHVPAGIAVQVPIPTIYRDPTFFPDPDRFHPERFLDNSSNVDTIMAFGDGSKNCIGKRTALLLLTVVISCVLKEVRLGECAAIPKKLDFRKGAMFLSLTKQSLVIRLGKKLRSRNATTDFT